MKFLVVCSEVILKLPLFSMAQYTVVEDKKWIDL